MARKRTAPETKEQNESEQPKLPKHQWSVEGEPWTYRNPFQARKRWRARRRNRLTGKVEMLTLEGATSRSDAKSKIQDLAFNERKAHEEGEEPQDGPQDPKDALLGKALDLWAKTLDVRENTLAGYQKNNGLYKKLLGEERHVDELAYGDLENLFTGQWKDASGRTKILHRRQLSRFFNWCKLRGYVRQNPAERIIVQKRWQKESARAIRDTGQALTLEEMRKLLAACLEPNMVDLRPDVHGKDEQLSELETPAYLWLFTFLSLRTGLRVSNLLGSEHKPPLQWQHLSLEKATLKIPGEFMKNGETFSVPLHPEVVEVLMKERRVRYGKRIPPKRDPVIEDPPRDLEKLFRAALKRAKLQDGSGNFTGDLRTTGKPRPFRLHDLRHAALNLMGEHLPELVVACLAGHAGGSVTRRYATHHGMETMREHLEKLPYLLKGQAKTTRTKQKANRV